MLNENIKKLVQYGIDSGLMPECERVYATNLLLECFKEDEYEDVDCDLSHIELEEVLKNLPVEENNL
jgi:UDPglucose--hexose-1-phosphate uridylyltransferase